MPIYALGTVAPELPENGRFWIAPDANVIGNVSLGEDVGVWFGVTIRGDNEKISIGARSNVQEGCIFHTDIGFPLTIGEDCTIGHGAILHGCTLGNGVLIGMGAVVLNGAHIPDGCLVGAHALVTEGKVFAPNSLIVGSPARSMKALDAAGVARLKGAAAHYVQNSRRFKADLREV